MIGLALLATVASGPYRVPPALVVATPRGEVSLAVASDAEGRPMIPAFRLVAALAGSVRQDGPWVTLVVSRQDFAFLPGAPLFRLNERLEPLAAPAEELRDTLFVPYQFVSEILPRYLGELYRFDRAGGRLVQLAPTPAPTAVKRLPNGLLPGHIVTVDAGHGGNDPGNPGRFLPAGVTEKDVTLQVALLLRDELVRRGISVRMTRTTDVRPNLLERAPTCDAQCDLFISLHVDALDPRRRSDYRSVNGFSTLIIGVENSADADRVAQTENEALRFETAEAQELTTGPLGYILRDLQMNEYLRESARAGALMQAHLEPVHPGVNRGVKQRNDLAVLNTGRRPGVLVEMGYGSSPSDAKFLASRSGQRKIATALADAIVDYLLELEWKSGLRASGPGQ